MSQVHAGLLGLMGVIWLGVAAVARFLMRPAFLTGNPGPMDTIWANGVSNAIMWPALLLTAAFIAAAVGIVRKEPWARGLAFLTTWFSALTLIGLPWAIAQFFVLKRE